MSKISGPLLDRIDLHIEVTPVPFESLSKKERSEPSQNIQERVVKARSLQEERFSSNEYTLWNADMSTKQVREVCTIDKSGENLIKRAMDKLGLSARAYDRILKVARTISDLSGSDQIQPEHLAEAIQYRSLDKDSWVE
jgi:magnesium chelatase family protein